MLKHGEEFVGASVDLVTATSRDMVPDDVSMVIEDLAVGIAKLLQEHRRALDIGQQESQSAGRQPAPYVPLRAELLGDETDRHDAVSLRGHQQLLPSAVFGRLGLEVDLLEAR